MTDWPAIAVRFAYWGFLISLLLLLLFLWISGSAPHNVGMINDGTATVNNLGTVTAWPSDCEAVTGIEGRRMIGSDVFSMVPESNRVEARSSFERSLSDDKLYPWPRVACGQMLLTFRRQDEICIAAMFSR